MLVAEGNCILCGVVETALFACARVKPVTLSVTTKTHIKIKSLKKQ